MEELSIYFLIPLCNFFKIYTFYTLNLYIKLYGDSLDLKTLSEAILGLIFSILLFTLILLNKYYRQYYYYRFSAIIHLVIALFIIFFMTNKDNFEWYIRIIYTIFIIVNSLIIFVSKLNYKKKCILLIISLINLIISIIIIVENLPNIVVFFLTIITINLLLHGSSLLLFRKSNQIEPIYLTNTNENELNSITIIDYDRIKVKCQRCLKEQKIYLIDEINEDCIICYDNKKNIIYEECNHIEICHICCIKLLQKN